MFGLNKEKKHGLHIMIIGCGKVGRTIIEQLCLEGHDITVIDKNPAKVEAQRIGELKKETTEIRCRYESRTIF